MAYQPAGNTTGSPGLAHIQSIYYKKKGLDRLQKKFLFRGACDKDNLPKQNGRTVQFFRYSNLSANTSQTVEGTVGSSLSLNSKILGATVSQYSAFITISDFVQDTAYDPMATNAAELLGYSAGLSVDTMTRNIIDAEFAAAKQNLLSSFLKVADLRAGRSALQAVDVEPFEDGKFYVIMHPFSSYDLVNDPAAGGLADIFKYTGVKDTPLVRYEDRGHVTDVAGCRVVESTNVKVTAGSPNTYRVYLFGNHGVGSVDLEGRGPTDVVDPKRQRFAVNVIPGKPQIADPEGNIGAAVSYNYIYTAVVLDGPPGMGGTYRFRLFDAPSSIG
jgi:N4-gp56 family major capsid protein